MFGRDGRALEALEKALIEERENVRDLQERLRTVEHELQSVTADSLLQWEKVNRALGRLAKRTEAEATERGGSAQDGARTPEQLNAIIRAGGDPWPTRS